MLPIAAYLVGLVIAGADQPVDIRIESAQLTLIEQADISASEAGLVSQITVKEGQTIEEGAPLARLDDREARLMRLRAETEVAVARAQSDNDIKVRFARLSAAVAEAELRRAQESNEKFPKSVSQTEIDRLKLLADKSVLEIEQAEIDWQQAKLALQVKQQDLERAALALERRTIVSPFPGMVVQWKRHPGEWVEPGTPVMRLVRLNRLRAEAFVASQAIPAHRVGQPATLIVEQEGKLPTKYSGRLAFVSPEVDPVNGQVRIWAEIDNSNLSLRPGQTATLVISGTP